MAQESISPIKHTIAGEVPDPSIVAQAERRMEADLPLLSDPAVQRVVALVAGALVIGFGAGIYFFRNKKR